MKKYLPHIFIVALILGWTGVFGVHEAHAQALAILKFADSPIEYIFQFMGNMVLQAMSFFIYISGLLLDYSLNWTLNIASLVEKIPAIETGWKVFRDLCTMFFIFILLYTAITTILGVGGGKENAKKVLMTVVIAGLLINFSLFFTKLVIDASNVVSLGFYKALVPNPDGDLSTSKVFGLKRTGLSAIFMDSLYIQTTYDPSGLKPGLKNDKLAGSASSAEAPPFVRLLINTIMGSIVMLIASIVFLAAAFFFMVRIVILLLLMVTSPIAFAGQALGGKAKAQADKWWSALMDQCLFMPVYLAVTYVGIKIVASPGFQAAVNPGNGSISALTGGGSIAVIFNYCVIIIFLMASLIIAKEFGVKGAATFEGWAKNVGLALPRLGGSWAARNTLGWAGSNLDKLAGNTWIGNTGLGRSLRESSIGALAKNKFGGERSFKDQGDRDKENATKQDSIKKRATIVSGIGASVTSPEHLAMLNEVKNMSGKQIESLGLKKEQLEKLMPHLNKGQAEHMSEKSELPEERKAELRTARLKNIKDGATAGTDVTKELDKLSDSEIENLDPAVLSSTKFVEAISENPDRLKKLLGSSIEQPTKIAIKAEMSKQRNDALISNDSAKIKKMLASLPAKDLIEIIEGPSRAAIVNNPDFIKELKIGKLKELTNDLDESIKIDIGNKIMGQIPTHPAFNYISDPIGKTDRWRV